MAKPLPPGQARVLQAIAGLVRQGLSPTAHDLTRALGIRPQSLRQHLEALERKGLLRLHPTGHGRPTHLELTPAGRLLLGLSIPLVGSIPAGPLEASSEELAGLIALPGRPGLYALVVEGDSMAEYLLEGDVVVEKGPRPRPGEIAALLHEGKTTLKYVYARDLPRRRWPRGGFLRQDGRGGAHDLAAWHPPFFTPQGLGQVAHEGIV